FSSRRTCTQPTRIQRRTVSRWTASRSPSPAGRYSFGPSPTGLPWGSRHPRPSWPISRRTMARVNRGVRFGGGEPPALGGVGRVEPCGVGRRGGGGRGPPLPAQHPEPGGQARVLGVLVVPADEARQGV